jgi:hypothetical protein
MEDKPYQSFFDVHTRITLKRPVLQRLLVEADIRPYAFSVLLTCSDEYWWQIVNGRQERDEVREFLQRYFKIPIDIVWQTDKLEILVEDRNEALLFKLQQGF